MKLPEKVKPKVMDFREYKFLIYGDPGSGKSTFASKFPDAIFIPTEPGLNFLEVNQITN
jgi:GTPase SAR1 family protein